MHCFCIHLAVLQSYLSLFSHITCIHFATLGTQLDQKLIDWFLSYVLSSIFLFYMWTVENIFLRRYDNQCANIFSTYAIVYGSHGAMFAFYGKREYFFFMCTLNLIFFLVWFVCFYFSPPPLFFPKTVFPKTYFVFPIFIGGEIVF